MQDVLLVASIDLSVCPVATCPE